MQGKNLAKPEVKTHKFYDRESVDIKLNLSKDVIDTVEKIAKKKDLSIESVIKFFIGQGLRKELSPQELTALARKRLQSRKGPTESTDMDFAA